MTDAFTEQARAEGQARITAMLEVSGASADIRAWFPAGFEKGAEWARDHLAAQESTEAEQQLRAVRHVLDQHHDQAADGLWIDIDDQIPSGDLGNPDKACGKGPCALGYGHPGPCRC